MLTVLLLAGAIGVQEAPREPRHWPSLTLAAPPYAYYPDGEQGVVMVRVTCAVAEAGRTRDCRIDRRMPEDTRFGGSILRGMSRVQIADERARPGDTFSLEVWACPPAVNAFRPSTCARPDWPVDGAVAAD